MSRREARCGASAGNIRRPGDYTHGISHIAKTVIALIALIGAQALLAQTPMTHAVPGTSNDPVWQGLISWTMAVPL